MKMEKDFDLLPVHHKIFPPCFNAFSHLKLTSERLRWPPGHSADLPAAVWVCSGSTEDQQSHSAAEKWDENILPENHVNTPMTACGAAAPVCVMGKKDWRNFFLLSFPQPLTTSTFSTKKRRSRRRRFQCYGKKWWRWRSWKRELMIPLILTHHRLSRSCSSWRYIQNADDCEILIAVPDTLVDVF